MEAEEKNKKKEVLLEQPPTNPPVFKNIRERLAHTLITWIIFAFCSLFFIGILSANPNFKTQPWFVEILRIVYSSLFTLMATVVGFYFARKSFKKGRRKNKKSKTKSIDTPPNKKD